MAVLELTAPLLQDKLNECKQTYKLNVGYAGLVALPPGLVGQVNKHNPHVMELELSSNKLTDLPDELAELQHLRVLRVKYNNLTKLPEVLVRMNKLEILELSGNQITVVDDKVLELDLSNNTISEIGEGLARMASLQVLRLENNRIDALPDNIGSCKALVKLDLSTNNLLSLPDSMGQFRKLQRLNVANNMLRRVPASMGGLKTLKELDLRYNNLDELYHAKSEEGLSRLLAFLREEEERERLEQIERMKPIGTQVGSYMEYRCKADNAQSITQDDGSTVLVDNRCWVRTGHSICQNGSMLYVFGGLVLKDECKSNDVYWMTTDRMEWHLQAVSGDKPVPRDDHACVFDDTSNRLVVFGGRGADRKRMNDVHFLDVKTWTWHRPTTDGLPPTPRLGAAAVFMGGQMIIFGGYGAGARLNDLHTLDLTSWQWQQPAFTGTAPSPRQSPGIALQGSQLFVHGGRNNFVLEDMFVLDLARKEWTDVAPGAHTPPPRHGHLMAVHADKLYMYGGYDELGAWSDAMFCLPVPYDQPFTAASRAEWSQVGSEVNYNRCRYAVLHKGQVGMYQVGSPTLGQLVGADDIEKASVGWDVLRMAKLVDLKVKPLEEEKAGKRNAKALHIEHCLTTQLSKLPRGYTTTSPKEAAMLEYVDSWATVFRSLYPYRRPLFLTPKNEAGVRKLVCTTLRPTLLPHTDLYGLPGIVQFVASYFAYEPLANPVHYPDFLPSPSSVISWQGGDCFDMSTVLCSLLLGAGFDAYVVTGYAPVAVTTSDQTGATCPMLEPEVVKKPHKMMPVASAKHPAQPKEAKYKIKSDDKPESTFLQKQQQAKDAAAAAAAKAAPTAAAEAASSGPADSGLQKNNLVHAWVMVLAGKREVAEDIFIDASTGRSYPIPSSPFLGIESMWNHDNYWVCMQMPEPHSDSRATPQHLSLDVTDASKWEYMLPTALPQQALKAEDLEGDGEGEYGMTSGRAFIGNTTRSASAMGRTARPLGAAGSGTTSSRPPLDAISISSGGQSPVPQGLPTPTSATMKRASPARMGSVYGGESVASVARSEQEDAAPLDTGVPGMPPSWVPRLQIGRDSLDMRCPRGIKSLLYHRCQHEIFALFGECCRWDGMVEKLTLYEDDARSVAVEVREVFWQRKDKLQERRSWPLKETTWEVLAPGARGALKQATLVKGLRRDLLFYHQARLDSLVERTEAIGSKTIERFEGRDDHLMYRSIRYGPVERQHSDLKQALAPKGAKGAPAPPQEEDPGPSRVFDIANGCIRLQYHYGSQRVTADERIYHRDGPARLVQVMPNTPQPPQALLAEEHQALLMAERDCLQAVREGEREVRDLIAWREKDERAISLATPYYDVVRQKHGESDEEEEAANEVAVDYLTQFLPLVTGTRTMNRQEAMEVRERSLKALKERLVERANIIQARHDSETAALVKRQAHFQRDRDQMSREEEEEYEQACEDSMFKIHILDKRLKRHEEAALQSYYELDNKLRHDPRLAVLML
ncbi:TPA: hypothetical protein ACH3X2_012508 [Trebouxia sp. C0005]